MKVRLIINLGTKDKQRFGLKEKPALDGDVVDVTKEAADALKAEGKALDEGHHFFEERELREKDRRKTAAAGARVMDRTTPVPTTTDEDDRPSKETKKK
jgi:hypothetical protein